MEYGIAHGAPLDAPPDYSLFARPDAGDEQLFVQFYMGVLHDPEKSTEQGRPIFRDTEFVRVIVPGDKNNIVDRPATEADKRRFAKSFEGFKAGKREEDQLVGTRLTDWPPISRGQCEEFRYLGIRTVEQLAEVRDDVVSRVPGMRDLKGIAKHWLGQSKSAAEAAKQAQKERQQESRIVELESAVKDQVERIEKLLREKAEKA